MIIKCAQYLQGVRVIVSIYLKMEDYAKAESLVEESEFPPRGSRCSSLCAVVWCVVRYSFILTAAFCSRLRLFLTFCVVVCEQRRR
jgi:hypothetical protein